MRKKAANSYPALVAAWGEAVEDLHIDIEAPFVLTDKTGREIKYALLVKHFGTSLGTLILSTDDMSDFDTAEHFGYYCSALNPLSYATYERASFIETLNDWGYYGADSKKPKWYIGTP